MPRHHAAPFRSAPDLLYTPQGKRARHNAKEPGLILHLQRAARIAAWLAAFAVLALSLVPGPLRPHSGLPGLVEHFFAYFALAALFTFGHAGRLSAAAVALLLVAAAGAIEALQLFMPGRHAAFTDFLAGAVGSLAGAALAALALRLLKGHT